MNLDQPIIEYKNESHIRQLWDQINLSQLDGYVNEHGLSIDFIRQFQDKFDNCDVFWETIFWFVSFEQKQLEEFKDKPHWEQYFQCGFDDVSEEFVQKYRERIKFLKNQ